MKHTFRMVCSLLLIAMTMLCCVSCREPEHEHSFNSVTMQCDCGVIQDGVVAYIGSNYTTADARFSSLQAAVDYLAAHSSSDKTIRSYGDAISCDGLVIDGADIVLDFSSSTVSFTGTNGIVVKGDSDVELMGKEIKCINDSISVISVKSGSLKTAIDFNGAITVNKDASLDVEGGKVTITAVSSDDATAKNITLAGTAEVTVSATAAAQIASHITAESTVIPSVPDHTHNWVKDEVNSVPATCMADGVDIFTCSCGLTKQETVEKTNEHNFSSVVDYSWSDDFKCTATRACTNDGCTATETETVDGIYAVVTDSSCHAVGAATYTATFTNAAFAQQVKEVEIAMKDHTYGTPVYEWSLDNKCTATRTCTADGCTASETETVDGVYAVVEDSSCTQVGSATYTATFTNTAFAQQVKNVEIAVKDHTYDQEVVDEKYLVSSGSAGDVYKKSCTCGAASETETFTVAALNKTKSTHYATLTEALAAVSDGDEIVLRADQTMTATTIKVGITLDLNGHTISCTSAIAADSGILNFVGSAASHIGNVVIKNGTFQGSAASYRSNGLLRLFHVDDAVITNVDVISHAATSTNTCSNAIYCGYAGVTINNTDSNNIIGCVVIYMNDTQISKGAKTPVVAINGGNFSRDTNSSDPAAILLSEKASDGGTMTVTFNGGSIIAGSIATLNPKSATCVINAGTFCFDPTAYVPASGYDIDKVSENWVVSLHEHSFDCEVVGPQYLKEGDEYYKSCRCGLASETETFTVSTPASAPTFNIASGTYNSFQSVTISSAEGANIYYTTDGSEPTSSSIEYTGAFDVKSNMVIKAICSGNGYAPSEIASISVEIETVQNVTKSSYYCDLASALAAAADGDEIKLLCNQTIEPTKLTFGITLDLNGYTISGAAFNAQSNVGLLNFEGTKAARINIVAIKNGAVTGAATGNMSSGLLRFLYVDDAVITNVNIISNGASTATSSNAIYAGYTVLTINNSSTNTVEGRILCYMNNTVSTTRTNVILNGGVYKADTKSLDTYSVVLSDGTGQSLVTFNNADVESVLYENGVKSKVTVNKTDCPTIIMDAGTIGLTAGSNYTLDGTTPTASSDVFADNIVLNQSAVVKAVLDASEETSLNVVFKPVYNYTLGASYADLTAALSKVASGNTIVLYSDQTIAPTNKSFGFILDLNGHTITGNAAVTADQTAIINFKGSATSHIDKAVVKNGTIVGTAITSRGDAIVRFFDVEDAQIINLNVTSNANSTATVSNAVYNGYGNLVIDNTSANTIVGAVITFKNDGATGVLDSSTVIKGGNFRNDPTSNDPAAFVLSENKDNGGTLSLTILDAVVTSGNITAINKKKSSASIEAGTFCFDPTAYVATGSAVTSENPWIVTKE